MCVRIHSNVCYLSDIKCVVTQHVGVVVFSFGKNADFDCLMIILIQMCVTLVNTTLTKDYPKTNACYSQAVTYL